MKVKIIEEHGYTEALLGTSLSRNQEFDSMVEVCKRLAQMDGGHNKFLEFITVWMDIDAPRYWWQQMATYRIGSSWLSESTMYTLTKKPLTKEDFESPILPSALFSLNCMIDRGDLEEVKNNLPEGFLQRRIMVTNYKALRNIYQQRKHHKLPQWRFFCETLIKDLQHPFFLLTKGDLE
jgi:hypothetical protein